MARTRGSPGDPLERLTGARLTGAELRARRRELGLTQAQMADRLGVRTNTVARWERDEVRPIHPEQVARHLDRLSRARRRSSHAPAGQEPAPAAPQRSNLPVQLSAFIGRERALADVQALLQSARLLSLVGTGGIGKTRLAVEAARALSEGGLAGVCMVELAPIAEASLVARSVARALNVVERPDQPLMETIAERIGDRQLLLVLDNCEHVVQACAEIAEHLLRRCAGSRILATSREALGVDGEVVWRVPSLSLPSEGTPLTLDSVTRAEAVRLFVERASQSRADFRLTQDNLAAIVRICTRLGGIPLAIELAAARVNALSIEQIASRLDDSLRLLASTSRTAVDRQRTLRRTLDWSYDLLDDSEQRLLARLAVFAGGCTLEAAEEVCGGEGLDSNDVLNLLSNLVAKSLIVAEDLGATTWYRLLDPLREYGLEKLRAAREEAGLRSRHRDLYVKVAEHFSRESRTPLQSVWAERMQREDGNIRAALRWCLDQDDVADGLRIAAALARPFWDFRNRGTEGRAWLAELLGRQSAGVPETVLARALNAAGFLAVYQGDPLAAEAHLVAALDLWQGTDDGPGKAEALVAFGLVAQICDDYPRAARLYEGGLAVARECGERSSINWALTQLGTLAQRTGDYARARALHEESLRLKQVYGDAYGIGMTLRMLAQIAWLVGDLERAFELGRQSLRDLTKMAHWRGIGTSLLLLAHLTADAGGEPERGAKLFGAAEALFRRLGDQRSASMLLSVEPARPEASVAAIRRKLAAPLFETAWAAGAAMTIEEAVTLALDIPADGASGVAAEFVALTPRETAVLRLIADGSTNHEIASTLVLSVRTVERHIANVYAKIGARNRAEATAYALRSGVG